jgi:50S ribosomal protein L16 3-hydroxylase
VLAPGDMLYLPPQCAHNGIAEDNECMTYSIGFRTPAYHELAEQFLVYLQDRIRVEGMYADPDLKAQKHPSEISAAMLSQVTQAIDRIQWNKGDVAAFLGCYLSEPKPHIFFDAPTRPLNRNKFAQALQTRGAMLDLKTQMLCHGRKIFINGETHTTDKDGYRALRVLADTRQLPAATALPQQVLDLLYQWYVDGYIAPMTNKRKASS